MSDTQDFSAGAENTQESTDSMAVLPNVGNEPKTANLKELEESLDGQSYFLGEVPQTHQLDPNAFLPLNSDRLIGSVNMIDKLLSEVSELIEDEVNHIQKLQKKITFWEDRIEKNKAMIQKNLNQMRQNGMDVIYDKKNRDYWHCRSEDVEIDYAHAEVAGRASDWAWLIKKYGLKNPDSSEIDSKNPCVEELCNGAIKDLAAEYKATGDKYEQARKAKENDNTRMFRENAKFEGSNETLQSYIAATYTNEIEPLQDGVLLLKELGVKLKALSQEGEKVTYGQIRDWAEAFLDSFIKANSRVSQSVVTDFRRLTSIPLRAENS